jgi:hypothetical protein
MMYMPLAGELWAATSEAEIVLDMFSFCTEREGMRKEEGREGERFVDSD